MSSFRGVGTALITPFTESGALDEAALQKFVDWQITEGVNFLVPCGTTGENPTLTAEEHARVVELTVKAANGRVPVLAGAGSNNTPRAVELALQAVDLGADGILTITPYYNKPTPDGLRGHFGAQAEAVEKKKTGFPMIMYNVPGRTGLNMTAETTLRMAHEIPNVIGVKEASGNLEQILHILRERPKDFLVLSGDDAWTLPLMSVGAEGVISVASNEVPRLMRQLVDTRDVALHERLLPLLFGNFIEANPGPAKTALVLMGVLASDTVRPPLAPLTEPSRAKMQSILKECDLL
ncbi:MAG TPA: 4-hydroxy-tetrahydrodipicolinate synthase [Thermoanaerobaculia bacterium]|jgi:4-hydroxy-tetrahydrodipicolinate synthase